jgi:hypothetical protein
MSLICLCYIEELNTAFFIFPKKHRMFYLLIYVVFGLIKPNFESSPATVNSYSW